MTENKMYEVDISEIEIRYLREVPQEEIISLAESIRAVGQISPISLAGKFEEDDTGKPYLLVDGLCRLRAVEHNGGTKITATIKHYADPELAMFTANFQRRNFTVPEEISLISRLAEKSSVAAIAKELGKTPAFVANRIQLSKLIPELAELLNDKTVPLSHLEEAAKLSPANQADFLNSSGWYLRHSTLADLRKMINDRFFRKLADAKFDTVRAGCHSCPNRSGAQEYLFSTWEDADDRCLNAECFNRHRAEKISEQIATSTLPKVDCYYGESAVTDMVKEITGIKPVAKCLRVSLPDKKHKANAVAIAGEYAGKEVYVDDADFKNKTEKATAAAPEKPLKEQIAELENKYLVKCQKAAVETLQKRLESEYEAVKENRDFTIDFDRVIALAVARGVSADVSEYHNISPAIWTDKEGNLRRLYQLVILRYVGKLKDCLRDASSTEIKLRSAEEFCAMANWDFEEAFLRAAQKNIAPPKKLIELKGAKK